MSKNPAPPAYPLPLESEEYCGQGVASRNPHDSSFLELVDQRKSVREFTNDPIDDEVLYNALRVARLAPSAGNRQAYQVVIVSSRIQKQELAAAAIHQEWIARAPVILVFLADEEQSGHKYHDRGRYLYAVQDATIAAAYTQLALEAAGLASCWVGAFREDVVADIVAPSPNYDSDKQARVSVTASIQSLAPDNVLRPVVIMPVGVAAEHPRRHHRRSIREFVHRGHVGSVTKLQNAHDYWVVAAMRHDGKRKKRNDDVEDTGK